MPDVSFFTRPVHEWQRRYEALRASFVERLPAKVVAERFGYSYGYVRLLRHLFTRGKIDFSEPVPEGKTQQRRAISAEYRAKIRSWRERRLSGGEITQLLSEEGVEVSVRTVERVLAEEGFHKLPRRTRLKVGRTVKGAEVPARAERIDLATAEGQHFESPCGGVFLFAPFLDKLDIDGIVQDARLPGTETIPAKSYLLSFLALKLLGTERFAHVGDHSFDPGLGLFAALNVLPKCTSMSSYSCSLGAAHIQRLQQAFITRAAKLGLYDGKVINLDFHSVPHFGEESVLDKNWVGARGKRMKSALTLFTQDAESRLLLYTNADIQREEADDQVLRFLAFWKGVQRGVQPKLVFDSRFTSYSQLSELNDQGIKFIALRRRGGKLLASVNSLSPWQRIHVPHAKRKYPNPEVHESTIKLRGYEGDIRQAVVRGNGHEKPSFLISNDFEAPIDLLVGDYARRWRVENGIAEAVKFFHLNSLSSPILTKVHFDVVMTAVADTLYTMLAKKLRGFEDCNAPKLYRHFIRGQSTIGIEGGEVVVTFARHAHNPILRDAAWDRDHLKLPGLDGAPLALRFL